MLRTIPSWRELGTERWMEERKKNATIAPIVATNYSLVQTGAVAVDSQLTLTNL